MIQNLFVFQGTIFGEYNNCYSDNKQITHEVLQGSILGPLLFILYMNMANYRI